MKLNWRDWMTIAFFSLFAVLVFTIWYYADTISRHPCEICSEQYGLTCYSFEKNINIYPNGTQDDWQIQQGVGRGLSLPISSVDIDKAVRDLGGEG